MDTNHSAVVRTGFLGEGILISYPCVAVTCPFGGDCSGGEGPESGTSSVQTLALLSRYFSSGKGCFGNESGFSELRGFRAVGLLGARVGTGTTVANLSSSTGNFGSLLGMLDLGFGLRGFGLRG
jgi:hypothetical protein